MSDPLPIEQRYRAVRLRRRTVNLSAGVEDRTTGDVIRVANASMAVRLARLMNDEAEGKPLPAPGHNHSPIRFQLAHDPALPSPGAAVLYVHSMNIRAVAWAPAEEEAQRVARLLTHVDYPMDERPGLDGMFHPPKAHDFGDKLAELPLPTGESRVSLKPYRKRILGIALWSWVPLVAVAVFAALAIGWIPVAAICGASFALLLIMRRGLRQ